MIDRRSILAGSSAFAVAGSSSKAQAATKDLRSSAESLSEAYKKLHSVRFPAQDMESTMDFLEGFKLWFRKDRRQAHHVERMKSHLKSIDIDPDAETDLTAQQSFEILLRHPVYAAQIRSEWTMMDLMWGRASRYFHKNRDKFLSMLEETDDKGPGSLELNPDMRIPEHAMHEIHRMPGGYVGDPFSGFVFHWALARAYGMGRNEHGEFAIRIAQKLSLPKDGNVKRIIDLGCASGMCTTAYAERFPEADVWGLDVGGPMVRFAHHRAVNMGVPVHFVQRLAEDTKFPDNHFDVVADHLLFHETSAASSREIVKEIHRILRPGGVWKHHDLPTDGNEKFQPQKTLLAKAQDWNASRHNYEPYWFQWQAMDFPQEIRNAGFEINIEYDWSDSRSVPAVTATKPA